MSSATRTILVTGFEPFGGETVNASWEAARKLDGLAPRRIHRAVARLLPCAYDASVKELIRAIETLRPEALLMTGQAARRGVVCVERFARNLDDAAAPDNHGVPAEGGSRSPRRARVARGGGAGQDDCGAIRGAGIPARVSRSAGGFVCNHLYFGALQYLRRRTDGRSPAVFVHLPATPGQTPRGGERRAARRQPKPRRRLERRRRRWSTPEPSKRHEQRAALPSASTAAPPAAGRGCATPTARRSRRRAGRRRTFMSILPRPSPALRAVVDEVHGQGRAGERRPGADRDRFRARRD